MKRYICSAVFLSILALTISACFNSEKSRDERIETGIESIFTDLSSISCKKLIDQDDPNSTPYQICPGVYGYSLIIRHVGSGRQSIDVVTPSEKKFSLKYHEIVTRHMFHLGDKAEWRVSTNNGIKSPIALIIRLQAHEDDDEPELVTHSYLILTKIAQDEICVINKILAGSLSQVDFFNEADFAFEKKCLEPLPH